MMSHPKALTIPTASVYAPLLERARYKGARGGRGAGKSNFFASLVIEECLANQSLRVVCAKRSGSYLAQSVKKLIELKLQDLGLGAGEGFRIFRDVITTPGDGLMIFCGINDHFHDHVASLEAIDRAWIDDAQLISQKALEALRLSICKDQSELWFSWQPRFQTDPVERFFQELKGRKASVLVQSSWSDNPFFPKALDGERQICLNDTPQRYDHIWQGAFLTEHPDGYYGKELCDVRANGQITDVRALQDHPTYAYWDLGISDLCVIWMVQFIDKKWSQMAQSVLVFDYYETQNAPLHHPIDWLKSHNYGQAKCVLPHDGGHRNLLSGQSIAEHLAQSGFDVKIIPNQGLDAAQKRIQWVKQILPKCLFDQVRCAQGLRALSFYHEKLDHRHAKGVRPVHDWSSHAADAFGLLALDWQQFEKIGK